MALVQRRKQEEEGVELEAKGKWASEDYMKETLKFKEHLGLHWTVGFSIAIATLKLPPYVGFECRGILHGSCWIHEG